jgi:hypothetical protein
MYLLDLICKESRHNVIAHLYSIYKESRHHVHCTVHAQPFCEVSGHHVLA